jgi:hypothetical protein
VAQVADWLAAMGPPNGRKFFILGRTDDLALNATKAENDTYNAGLAQARANAAQNLLTGAGISAGDIPVFAEPSPVAGAPSGIPPRFTDPGRSALPVAHVAGTHPVWNDRWTANTADNTTRVAPSTIRAAALSLRRNFLRRYRRGTPRFHGKSRPL